MRAILTAILAFVSFEPLSQLWLQSDTAAWLLSLESIAPSHAALVGVNLIWPAIFLLGCSGCVSVCFDIADAVTSFVLSVIKMIRGDGLYDVQHHYKVKDTGHKDSLSSSVGPIN